MRKWLLTGRLADSVQHKQNNYCRLNNKQLSNLNTARFIPKLYNTLDQSIQPNRNAFTTFAPGTTLPLILYSSSFRQGSKFSVHKGIKIPLIKLMAPLRNIHTANFMIELKQTAEWRSGATKSTSFVECESTTEFAALSWWESALKIS